LWPFDTKASEPLNDLSNTRSLIGVKGHSGTSSICTSVQAEELKELLMDEKLMKNLTWLKILFHFPTDCCQSHLFKVCSNVGQFLKMRDRHHGSVINLSIYLPISYKKIKELIFGI